MGRIRAVAVERHRRRGILRRAMAAPVAARRACGARRFSLARTRSPVAAAGGARARAAVAHLRAPYRRSVDIAVADRRRLPGTRKHPRDRARDRHRRVDVAAARDVLRRPARPPARPRLRRPRGGRCIAHVPVPGARAARLGEGRRVRRRRDRRVRRAGRPLHAVSAAAPVRARVARSRRPLVARRTGDPVRLEQGVGLRRRRVEFAAARFHDGDLGDAAGALLRADRHAFAAARAPRVPRAVGTADDHAAVCHRPGAHPPVRPLGRGQCSPRARVRHHADALDLWPAGRVARANAGADTGSLSGAGRRRRRHQSRLRGGGADVARVTVADLHVDHAAADGAGVAQRVSGRVHREPRGLRQSVAARRQSRGPVRGHLFRDRRRAAGPRPRGDARHHPARPVAAPVPDPAPAARAAQLRHHFRPQRGRASGRRCRAR